MANARLEKVEIDGKKLMEIIKKSGYSLKTLAAVPEISRSDRSIRYAIDNGQITEELLQKIAYVIDFDWTQVLVKPLPVTKKKRTRENIKRLADFFCGSIEGLAEKTKISYGELFDVINNNTPISKELLEELSYYFGLSPEELSYGDFSNLESNMLDMTKFTRNMFELLPLFNSEETQMDPKFVKVFNLHKAIYEAANKMEDLEQSLVDEINEVCPQYYFDLDAKNDPVEAWANALSFYFYYLIQMKGLEILARYIYQGEQYPVFLDKLYEANPAFKPTKMQLEESYVKEGETPFTDLIRSPDYEKEMNGMLRVLKRKEKWSDLADYYMCLQYALGAVDNHYSYEQNQDFGFGLMKKLRAMGNRYARNFYKILYSD